MTPMQPPGGGDRFLRGAEDHRAERDVEGALEPADRVAQGAGVVGDRGGYRGMRQLSSSAAGSEETAASRSRRQAVEWGPKMPAGPPAAAERTSANCLSRSVFGDKETGEEMLVAARRLPSPLFEIPEPQTKEGSTLFRQSAPRSGVPIKIFAL